MNETRVNLKHLLEDIRDSYPLPLEEVIIVELIANALDSGASKIDFTTNPLHKTITIADNGHGMRKIAMRNYHNVASTTKVRGKGIGFAGVGAKLSLLIAESVVTETRAGRGTRCSTDWHLSSDTRAPWKFIPSEKIVAYPKGTAVRIVLADPNSPLLDEKFVENVVMRQFYPLFIPDFFNAIYRYLYPRGLSFSVNGASLSSPQSAIPSTAKIFKIIINRRIKQIAGFGYLAQLSEPSDEDYGLSVSTFGKIIKSGWEWVGITPRGGATLSGFVEIPQLSEVLTINKMDFLRDSTSLKKYYRVRKAIQSALSAVLAEFGEPAPALDQLKTLRPLTRQLEHALRRLAGRFPEILPLLGVKSLKGLSSLSTLQNTKPLVGVIETAEKIDNLPPRNDDAKPKPKSKDDKQKLSRQPAIAIGFESDSPDTFMARMVESKILINDRHPAYVRAVKESADGYHIALCVALELSKFLDNERNSQGFIDEFLSSWGKENPIPIKLF